MKIKTEKTMEIGSHFIQKPGPGSVPESKCHQGDYQSDIEALRPMYTKTKDLKETRTNSTIPVGLSLNVSGFPQNGQMGHPRLDKNPSQFESQEANSRKINEPVHASIYQYDTSHCKDGTLMMHNGKVLLRDIPTEIQDIYLKKTVFSKESGRKVNYSSTSLVECSESTLLSVRSSVATSDHNLGTDSCNAVKLASQIQEQHQGQNSSKFISAHSSEVAYHNLQTVSDDIESLRPVYIRTADSEETSTNSTTPVGLCHNVKGFAQHEQMGLPRLEKNPPKFKSQETNSRKINEPLHASIYKCGTSYFKDCTLMMPECKVLLRDIRTVNRDIYLKKTISSKDVIFGQNGNKVNCSLTRPVGHSNSTLPPVQSSVANSDHNLGTDSGKTVRLASQIQEQKQGQNNAKFISVHSSEVASYHNLQTVSDDVESLRPMYIRTADSEETSTNITTPVGLFHNVNGFPQNGQMGLPRLEKNPSKFEFQETNSRKINEPLHGSVYKCGTSYCKDSTLMMPDCKVLLRDIHTEIQDICLTKIVSSNEVLSGQNGNEVSGSLTGPTWSSNSTLLSAHSSEVTSDHNLVTDSDDTEELVSQICEHEPGQNDVTNGDKSGPDDSESGNESGMDEADKVDDFLSGGKHSNKEITSSSKSTEYCASECMSSLPYLSALTPKERTALRDAESDSDSYVFRVKCDLCSWAFPTLNMILDHMATFHGTTLKRPFKCVMCNVTFRCKVAVRQHGFAKHFSRLCCFRCGMMFKTRRELTEHRDTHFQKYSCKICGMRFLRKHLAKDHMSLTGHRMEFQCEICGKFTEYYDQLKDHKDIHVHSSNQYKCSLCSFVCSLKSDLLAHEFIHLSGKESFDKEFVISRKHHSPVKKPRKAEQFLCPICGHVSKTKTHFKKHVLIHGEKQHACTVCGKKFRADYLIRHMEVHSSILRFLCHICGKLFKRYSDFSQHLITHSKNMPFICSVCGKEFKRKHNLASHSRTHTQERNFKCDICGNLFRWKHNMELHQKTHSKL